MVVEKPVYNSKVQGKWYNYIDEWGWVDKYVNLPEKVTDNAYYATAEFENALEKALEEEIDLNEISKIVRELNDSIANKEIADVPAAFNSKISEMNALGYDKYIEFMNNPDWKTTDTE